MRFCIPESQINPAIHEIFSGPYGSEGECLGGCGSSSSSICPYMDCTGDPFYPTADCGLLNPGSVIDCDTCECAGSSSSSSSSSGEHALQFYPITSQNVGAIFPGVRFSCYLRRSEGGINASVNGSCPITFNDTTTRYAVADSNTLLFCIDDLVVPGENDTGTIHRIELRNDSVPTHIYELNGSLADSLGGPSLVANGGTITNNGYVFGGNQGLTLTGALSNTESYTIMIDLTFDTLNGTWQKIIDFKNRGSDSGLYVYRGTSSC